MMVWYLSFSVNVFSIAYVPQLDGWCMSYIVGELKLCIMQKHKKVAPARYTAEVLYMECLNTG